MTENSQEKSLFLITPSDVIEWNNTPWKDTGRGGHDWQFWVVDKPPIGYAALGDTFSRRGGHGPPEVPQVFVTNDKPLVAKPCDGYTKIFTMPPGTSSASLFMPTTNDPNYVPLGLVISRTGNDVPPPVGAYYVVNKAFLIPSDKAEPNFDGDSNYRKDITMSLYSVFPFPSIVSPVKIQYNIRHTSKEVFDLCTGVTTDPTLSPIDPVCAYYLENTCVANDIRDGGICNSICSTDYGKPICDKIKVGYCKDNTTDPWCSNKPIAEKTDGSDNSDESFFSTIGTWISNNLILFLFILVVFIAIILGVLFTVFSSDETQITV